LACDVARQFLLETLDALSWLTDLPASLVAREIVGEAVHIDHRGKPGVPPLILLHPKHQVSSELAVVSAPASEIAPAFSTSRDPASIDEDAETAELRSHHLVDEAFFSLSFHDYV
jgi:hypothetical protein